MGSKGGCNRARFAAEMNVRPDIDWKHLSMGNAPIGSSLPRATRFHMYLPMFDPSRSNLPPLYRLVTSFPVGEIRRASGKEAPDRKETIGRVNRVFLLKEIVLSFFLFVKF